MTVKQVVKAQESEVVLPQVALLVGWIEVTKIKRPSEGTEIGLNVDSLT